jgi:hypothetical protein
MYADPQSVTVGAVTETLPRVPTTNPTRVGQFSSADGNLILSVHQNQTANRFRREIRLTQRKIAADPISAVNKEVSASVILSIDEPKVGFSDADLLALYEGLVAYAAASSDAAVSKALGGEN